MPCTGAWATAGDYIDFWCIDGDVDAEVEATVNNLLEIAASDIHSALAAANACDCTLAGWAEMYLKKLNIVDAVVYHHCICARPHISDDMKVEYLRWIDAELELIRTGKKELCEGATGADFPAADYAELTWTNFNVGRILENEAMRRGG
jgi:hypothetical protein